MSARIAAQDTLDSGEVTVQVIDRSTGLCELQFTLLQVSCSCSTLPELQGVIGAGLQLCELQLHYEYNTYDAELCWQDIALHCSSELGVLIHHCALKVPCD